MGRDTDERFENLIISAAFYLASIVPPGSNAFTLRKRIVLWEAELGLEFTLPCS
jgi:hypothetical protein